MHALAAHLADVRSRHADEELCVVFDIDGTILDLRHLVVHVLLGGDRRRGTRLFHGLVADDVAHHEDAVEELLSSLDVPLADRAAIAADYRAHLWDDDAVLAASRPFEGVLGVIRWFQLQPRMHVALNTGRVHAMRHVTATSLATIGEAFRVRFDPALLFTASPGVDVPAAKVEALRSLAGRGLRVVAVFDNEPSNLRAMADATADGDVLFLHADTISASTRLPHDRLVTGSHYRLRELVSRDAVPRLTFVWHGVNDVVNLERFLASDVGWAEVDLRRDPFERIVLRHDAFERTPWRRDEVLLPASDAIPRLVEAGRCVKLDLKEGGPTLGAAIELADALAVGDERLWFNAELQALGEEGFGELRRRFPGSTISCPVDATALFLLASPTAAGRVLGMLRGWGVSRLSIRWTDEAGRILDVLQARGWEVNVYDVPDLEAFLGASLLLPTSVTADFDFPEWGYAGRGSGADGAVHLVRA